MIAFARRMKCPLEWAEKWTLRNIRDDELKILFVNLCALSGRINGAQWGSFPPYSVQITGSGAEPIPFVGWRVTIRFRRIDGLKFPVAPQAMFELSTFALVDSLDRWPSLEPT